MFHKTFHNKTVLVTGHTGFKGSWLTIWLTSLGAKVVGLSVDIPSDPSQFEVANLSGHIDHRIVDIRDADAIRVLVEEVQPDFIFHLAAQSLVRQSYKYPLKTMMTNAMGSANLLAALRILDKPAVAIMVTSDKAYDNNEWAWGYRETDKLGGKDPYSASKGMAELAIHSFVESYFNSENSNIRIGIARAGNVIGGGDWAVDRIVPDCIRAWAKGNTVDIRNPNATRPWQHVLEPLSGYLLLAANLAQNECFHGDAYNFGPPADQNHSVAQLIDEMSCYWDSVRWNDVSQDQTHLHEAGLLKLNCDKAFFDLQWRPALQFKHTVRMTVEWYKQYYQCESNSIYDLTVSQIDEYVKLATSKDLIWTKND